MKTFYWYDFETFGANPSRDRPSQFAGIRTDEDYNVLGDPLMIYCKPARDMLPQPEACLITGITPQLAEQKGLSEPEFIRQIHREFTQPNTCVVGFNSIRFDDEVTRNSLYRNFYDPYAREWQNGNSRWDIIDMVRMARALRPEGINWPSREDGMPSFKLEQLTAANEIEHVGAHDALVDVYATINLAKLIKNKQPKLYDYVYQNKSKHAVEQQLNLATQKPVLHISSKYPAEKGCAAIVLPIVRDTVNKNAIYVYDLSVDPEPLLSLDVDQIRERIFTRQDDLPEGQVRVPLKAIHTNKCPIVAPVNAVTPEVAERLMVDLKSCREHMNRIKADAGLAEKVKKIFSERQFEEPTDPDLMIYSGGFFSSRDRQFMADIIATPPEHLANLKLPFSDARISEMLFRYRARNYPDTLNAEELQVWESYRRERLTKTDGGGRIALDEYYLQIEEKLRNQDCPKPQREILLALKEYGDGLLSA